MKKVIIFGTGEFAKNIYYQIRDKCNVIYFCDNNINKQNTKFFDIDVLSPFGILSIEFDEIIIASSYSEEIYTQLAETMNLDKSKIKKLYVNQSKIQFYSDDKRKKSEYFMFKILDLLNKNNISHYVDHGTLLGIVRDNSLIPWDKDVDIAVFIEDKEKIIRIIDEYLNEFIHPNCIENKWKYRIESENINTNEKEMYLVIEMQIFNDSSFQEDEVALDLMFRYRDESIIYWGVCGKYLVSPIDFCIPTKQIIYKDNYINVPNNIEKYLENLYGNWKITVKEWTYDKYNNI